MGQYIATRRPGGGAFATSPEAKFLRHEFFRDPTPESDWLAGLIAADGNISGKSWTLAQSSDYGRAMVEHVSLLVDHRLTLSSSQPKMKNANRSHSIYVPSSQMTNDLWELYGIGPRKTLTYGWPALDGARAANFLRGYIDGDGCVGKYHKTQHLTIALVGTAEFIQGLQGVVPIKGATHVIKRCKNLVDLRFNGRKAWAVGEWIYGDESLYPSPKFCRYLDCVQNDRPLWLRNDERRQRVKDLLVAGHTLTETAKLTETDLTVICHWKRKWREEAACLLA